MGRNGIKCSVAAGFHRVHVTSTTASHVGDPRFQCPRAIASKFIDWTRDDAEKSGQAPLDWRIFLTKRRRWLSLRLSLELLVLQSHAHVFMPGTTLVSLFAAFDAKVHDAFLNLCATILSTEQRHSTLRGLPDPRVD